MARYRTTAGPDPNEGAGTPAPGTPAAGGTTNAAPDETNQVPATQKGRAPAAKQQLWQQFVKAGKPGDWRSYWLSGGKTTPPPTGPTDPGSGPRPITPPGVPLNPSVPPGQPAAPWQMMPALGANYPQMGYGNSFAFPQYGTPYQPTMPGDFNDPYNAYLSAIPVMETMRDKQISDAMATAGFGGNRYSTAAMNQAGRIGAETSQQLNQMLNQTMYNQAQSDLDRAMQSAGMGMQMGSLQDEMQRARLNQLFGFGQYEQGRQDDFAKMAYQDFLNSRMGYLPLIAQVLGGVGAPTPGTAVQTVTDPGRPPTIPPELLPWLTQLFS